MAILFWVSVANIFLSKYLFPQSQNIFNGEPFSASDHEREARREKCELT